MQVNTCMSSGVPFATGASFAGPSHGPCLRQCPHRHFRLALRAVARRFLSARAAPAARAGIRVADAATIEINGTFYSLQRPESYGHGTTDAARLHLLGQRRPIHHPHAEAEGRATPLANFFAPACCALGTSSGRSCGSSRRRSASTPSASSFFACLPRDLAAASRWRATTSRGSKAAPADDRCRRPIRHAVEIRHPSFTIRPSSRCCAGTRRLGGCRYRRPLAAARRPDRRLRLHPFARRQGAVRQRLQRCRTRSVGRSHRRWRRGGQASDAHVASAHTATRRARGRDVFCYFDNDVKVHAPYDAAHLAARLGVATGLVAGERFVPPPGLAPPRQRSPAFS